MAHLLIYRNKLINLKEIGKIFQNDNNEIIFDEIERYKSMYFHKIIIKKNEDEVYYTTIQNLIENDLFPDFFLKVMNNVLLNINEISSFRLNDEIIKITTNSNETYLIYQNNEKKIYDTIKNWIDNELYTSLFLHLENNFFLSKNFISKYSKINNDNNKSIKFNPLLPNLDDEKINNLKICEWLEENLILKDNHILK